MSSDSCRFHLKVSILLFSYSVLETVYTALLRSCRGLYLIILIIICIYNFAIAFLAMFNCIFQNKLNVTLSWTYIYSLLFLINIANSVQYLFPPPIFTTGLFIRVLLILIPLAVLLCLIIDRFITFSIYGCPSECNFHERIYDSILDREER